MTSSSAVLHSLVVPLYRNEDTLGPLMDRLELLHDQLEGALEVVLVVDGSPDRTYELLRETLGRRPFPSQLIRLSRNYGSFAAIRSGLAAARGSLLAVMAADLQEPVELIESFFDILQEGDTDVVVGTRSARDDPFLDRLTANTFWRLYRVVVQPVMPDGGVDVFACTAAVRDALLSMEEAHSSLVGQLLWAGFRRREVPYTRGRRVAGRSGWTFRKKIAYMSDSMFSFSDLPIKLLLGAGILGIASSAGFALVVLVARMAGYVTVAGYTPIVLFIAFSLSLNLLALGLVGVYVWRAFENTKGRPLYLEISREEFGPRSARKAVRPSERTL